MSVIPRSPRQVRPTPKLAARAAHAVRRRTRELERAFRRVRGSVAGFGVVALLALLWPLWPGETRAPIGHVIRAYGSLRLGDEWRHFETGKPLTETLRDGDQLQTGEHSAAQMLFFGGSRLELEAGSVAQVFREPARGDVVIRMILGTGYFEFAGDSELGRHFAWEMPNGKLARVPRDERVIMTLHATRRLDDAVDAQSIEVSVVKAPARLKDPDGLELAMLANNGGEVEGLVPLIVPPIDEREGMYERAPAAAARLSSPLGHPQAIYPMPEAVMGVEEMERNQFRWKGVAGLPNDPIVAYEIVVRPAFNYEVDDTARKYQVFRTKNPDELPLARIGGSGVFLWSVRAVTAGGERSPSSSARWLEIKFPDMLRAPDLLTPKVE